MANTPNEVISQKLLEVYNAHADRRQAQLDLERAMAAEQYTGRNAVGGVFAQLKQMADKEAAKKAKIEKAKEEGAPPPAAMVPPLTEVDGRMGGRSAGQAMKAGADILETVLGGRGVKTGQVGAGAPGGGLLGSTGGINPGASAPGSQQPVQVAGPGVPTGTTQNPVPTAQPPPQTPTAPAAPQSLPAPGSTQVIREPLTKGQRIAAGLESAAGVLGGIATRSPGLAMAGIEKGRQAASGTGEILGARQVPTVAEQAKPLAEPLAAYVSATYNTDPISSARAQQLKQARLDQIEQEFGKDVRDSVEIQAFDKFMMDEVKRQQENEDPVKKEARFRAETQLGIEQAVLAGKKLTPEQEAFRELTKKSAASTVVNNIIDPNMGQLSKATINKLQGETVAAYPIMQVLDDVEKNIYDPAFTYVGKGQYESLKQMDKAGVLPERWKETLKSFHNNERAIAQLTVERVFALGGKALTETELNAISKTIVDMQNSPTQVHETLPAIREQFGLGIFRNATLLGKVDDPKLAQSLGSTRVAAQNQARALMLEYQNQGLSEDAAFSQVSGEYRNRYGLDLDRLMKR